MSLTDIKDLLKKAGLNPKKKFSQNFLFDDNTIEKIISFVPSGKGFYLEIGGGLGTLTEVMIKREFHPFTVIDMDDGMLSILKERFGNTAEIMMQDAAKIKFEDYFTGKKGFVIGNLPYQISSPIIHNTCYESQFLDGALFLLQKEVAEKLCAYPATRNFGPLAGIVKLVGKADYLFTLPPEEFYPSPKVNSALVKITFDEHEFDREYLIKFTSFMRSLFSNRRKNILNVFKINKLDINILKRLEINGTLRAESLDWDTILALSKAIMGE